jgi:hypothetical protein
MASITELGALVWELYDERKLTETQVDNIFQILKQDEQ